MFQERIAGDQGTRWFFFHGFPKLRTVPEFPVLAQLFRTEQKKAIEDNKPENNERKPYQIHMGSVCIYPPVTTMVVSEHTTVSQTLTFFRSSCTGTPPKVTLPVRTSSLPMPPVSARPASFRSLYISIYSHVMEMVCCIQLFDKDLKLRIGHREVLLHERDIFFARQIGK